MSLRQKKIDPQETVWKSRPEKILVVCILLSVIKTNIQMMLRDLTKCALAFTEVYLTKY